MTFACWDGVSSEPSPREGHLTEQIQLLRVVPTLTGSRLLSADFRFSPPALRPHGERVLCRMGPDALLSVKSAPYTLKTTG